jgi:hypothetical protein
MTEKSKKKMIVRRLEQIFVGKRSAPGSHSQPMQQQEIAQSAATADREQREAIGKRHKPEGQREAHIMNDRDAVEEDDAGQDEAIKGFRPTLIIEERDFTGLGSSPDQRPTRPLDLDPYSAQVPTDNMNYIRHLGCIPSDMNSGEAPLGHGWIYFNLLINMAQLHTLNVTSEFVKDAIHDYSSHIEISQDGRKIRWKGGRDVTMHSGDGSSEHYSASLNETDSVSSFKRMKTGTSGTSSDLPDESGHAKKLARVQHKKERNKFAYKPFLFCENDSENENDFYGFDAGSAANYSYQAQPTGNSSGSRSSTMQNSSSKPCRRADGPMIFYTKAQFFTDLSGDCNGTFLTIPGNYKPITNQPLGATQSTQPQTKATVNLAEPLGALDTTPMDVDYISGSRIVSRGDDFAFSPEALRNDSGNNSPELIEFGASGLGGVRPEDNFSIQVRRSQVLTAPVHVAAHRRSRLYPKAIKDVLNFEQSSPEVGSPRASPQRVVQEKILSALRKDLPSSTLPRASFLPLDSYSSYNSDSDLASDASSELDSDTDSSDGLATVIQITNIAPVGSEDSEESKSDYEDIDNGSVDSLVLPTSKIPLLFEPASANPTLRSRIVSPRRFPLGVRQRLPGAEAGLTA